ncbi:hypothetical protein LCGC14_2077770 [marine sediment metagenome]|uniref:Uncharacterized protein n=1 Tax=marine sediment metagenome TaxID=412755 RepID=A0A0F9HDE9_9ZZZZ
MSENLFDQCQIKDRKLKHKINLDWGNFIAFWGIKIADKIIEWYFRNKRDLA